LSDTSIVPDEIVDNLTAEHCTLARATARLTMKELAQAAGVHANTVNNFENGQGCRRRTRAKIAEGIVRAAGLDCLSRIMGA